MRALSQRFLLAIGVCAATLGVAHAQNFAALASPPRFELATAPGKPIRAVVEITNADARSAVYRIKTADWSIDKDYGVQFAEALQPDSCRPWVAIERREITVSGGGKYRYRFEFSPPANTPARECRFAIMIEGTETSIQTKDGVSFPVSGRLGLIVYVAVGAVAPKLEVVGSSTSNVNGEITPVILIKNSGTAHGRLAGFLSGKDAAGKTLEFTPSSLPILPGETRPIALSVNREDEKQAIMIEYPITIRGNLEWASESTPFEQRFAP
jgi:hypothetical protein